MKVIALKSLHCERCGHDWVPRKQKIYACPDCKSPRWNEAAEHKADEKIAREGRAR